jgi:hypothetical protein
MNKKSYIKPTAMLLRLSTSESIAGEVIINTSDATVIGGGGGELNTKEGSFFEGELNESDETIVFKKIPSLWDEEE